MKWDEIDFIQELTLASNAYDGKVGRWWAQQTDDRSHANAYGNIANHVHSLLQKTPSLIIDYACGPGNLLLHLPELFPDSRFIGIDVSALMLEFTKKRLTRLDKYRSGQIGLLKTELPDFSLPKGKANVVIFCFPQILWGSDQERYDKNGYRHDGDTEVAKFLAASQKPNPKDRWISDDAQMLSDSLLRGKVVSRNLRGLLKKGGICVRVEYGKAEREKLTELEQYRLAFEEGSLDVSMNGKKAAKLFDIVSSTYFRSKVTEDVYYQTKDETDRKGGYSITMLEAM